MMIVMMVTILNSVSSAPPIFLLLYPHGRIYDRWRWQRSTEIKLVIDKLLL